MTYFPMMGLGAEPPTTDLIDPSNFNDTKFPGIAYATNQATLDKFYELQKQLNRAAAAKGIATRVAKDGKIGAGTVALASQVSVNTVATSSVHNLAMYATIVAQAAKAKADAAGVSANPPAPAPVTPPAILNVSTNTLQAATPAGASLFGAFANMSTTMMLLLAIGVIGAGYYLTKPHKKTLRRSYR